jgi:hypothetical protein
VPGGVVDGSDDTTMLGMAQLGEEKRSGGLGDGTTEPDEETGGDEHGEGGSSGLERNPIIMKKIPVQIARRRPNLSEIKGAKGRPQMDPIPMMALKRPKRPPVGWLK